MRSSPYDRANLIADFDSIRISLASPEKIRSWSHGEVTKPETFQVTVDGFPGLEIDSFCADPITMRYEFNFKLPARIGLGPHSVEVRLGKRTFAPLSIEVA